MSRPSKLMLLFFYRKRYNMFDVTLLLIVLCRATVRNDKTIIMHMIKDACFCTFLTFWQLLQGSTLTVVWLPGASENGTQLVRSGKWKWFCDMFNSWRAKWLILNYSVLPKHHIYRVFYFILLTTEFPFLK